MKPQDFCYEKALSLLASAEHTRKGLARKLTARGFGEEEVSGALRRLAEEKLLDDRRYAELWIGFRQRRKQEGAGLLVEGLVKKGVDRRTAGEAVRSASSAPEYQEALARACERILKDGPMRKEEIVSRLLRKGFSLSEIRNHLENFGPEYG